MMRILHSDLSFIRPGQIWALVGESDSGNSQLLQNIQGRDIELVSFRHHFRNLSNTTDFYYQQRFNSCDSEDAPTVKAYLSAIQMDQPSRIWTYEQVVNRFRLQPLLDEQLIKLSNGETKRLLISAALIRNPHALLLDHPLTGLDVHTRQQFAPWIKEISDSGITVIIATNPWELPAAVTHVAVMKKGSIVAQLEKEQFKAEDFSFHPSVDIDIPRLQQLLTSRKPSPYKRVVEMEGVTIKYGDRTILDDIHWTVNSGERWSLSGPNGAGKSTLLSLLNGDNPQAYANPILLFDRQRGSGESIWDIKREIGFVSPELYQYFPMDSSCLQVIESGFYDTVGLFRKSDPQKAAVCTGWMGLLEISGYAEQLFSRVPSNIQRLCLLTRALVKNPTLLILDEPTQGLDSYQQQLLVQLIDAVCVHTDTTLIYVSHYKQHIPSCVTHAIDIENGRIIQCR